MAQRCPICNGSKQVLSLGNMLKDCDNCEAIGYVAEKIEEEPKEIKKITSIKERRERIIAPNKDSWRK
jgi:hypothetical protein